MPNSNAETNKECKIEDLLKFFKDRSKNISKVFSDELININTIRSRSIESNMQEFSFKLLTTTDKDIRDTISLRVKSLIKFFEICLYTGKKFIVNIAVSEESKEVCNNTWETVNEFIECAAPEVFLQGITIKLQVNIEDINLKNLHKVETRLEKKLKQAKNKKQSQIVPQAAQTNLPQQEDAQNKQVVPFRGSFGYNLTKKINGNAPLALAITEKHIPKWSVLVPLSRGINHLIQLLITPKLPTRKRKAITWHPEPQEVEQDKVAVRKETEPSQQTINIPHIVTDAIQPTLKQKAEKFFGVINDDDIKVEEIIKQAKNYAETAVISNEIEANEKQKTLDEIFCETVITYCDPKYPKFLMKIIDSVFKTIFLKDISKKREISEEDVLNTVKKFGLEFNKDCLISQINKKQDELCFFIQYSNPLIDTSDLSKEDLIQKAQRKAKEAIKNNNDKTRDEIFIEVIKNYRDQDRATFICIFDTVFNSIFCGDRNPDEIETFEEILNILKILEVQFDGEYLKGKVLDKKTQLSKLVLDRIKSQPENTLHKSANSLPINKSKDPSPATNKARTPPATNTAFKSSLKTVFSSKEAYFCLFVIGASISILCLWHFPLGKLPVLQGLVQQDKRENIGLMLNIGLPILIVLCIVNLAHFVYSEYSVESIGQVNSNRLPSRT